MHADMSEGDLADRIVKSTPGTMPYTIRYYNPRQTNPVDIHYDE